MFTYFAIGILLYGVVLVIFVFYKQYLRQLMERREGFTSVQPDVFLSKIVPGGNEERSVLRPNSVYNTLLVESSNLPSMDPDVARSNFSKMTSELCYRNDRSEVLKKTRNYLQRTNNYQHSHPDSCSAPNHELIGTFYSPFDGVGQTPDQGTNLPPSAICLRQ
jgi:hypothetical protein